MRSESFFQGLMLALTDYANQCGVDSDKLYDGGYEWDDELPLGSEERDYTHVRRKADFRRRVEHLLSLFLEEHARDTHVVSDEFKSVPVMTAEEVSSSSAKTKECAAKWLAEFKWDDLKSDDYATARRAWYHVDGLRGVCAMHDDTKAAFEAAAKASGIRF